MRSSMNTWIVIAAGVVGTTLGSAWGQLVPPPPPKTPATPPYTPPPPPPTPQPGAPTTPTATNDGKPPAPEAPLPSLIQKDEAGKMKPLAYATVEEAAVRLLVTEKEPLARVEASLAKRREDLDRLVIDKIDALMEIKAAMAKVNESTSMDDITTSAKKAQPFNLYIKVLDRLGKDGAIDPQTKSKAARIAREYQQAANEEAMKGVEHNNMQAMTLIGYRRFMDAATKEAFESLDRQLGAIAPKFDQLLPTIKMPDDMRMSVKARLAEAERKPTPNTPPEQRKVNAVKAVFFDVLGNEQRHDLLAANAPPPPAAEDKKDAPPTGGPATPAPAKK